MKNRLAFLLIASMHLPVQAQAIDLEACLNRAMTNQIYQAPTPTELTRAEELFERTLQGHWTGTELTSCWASLGFEFREITAGEESLWLLSDPEGREGGRGWYLFRADHPSSIALEAPHARNDLHTGIIALRLFLAGQGRVLAASTITRHRADVAHLEDTFFHAFTLAFARSCPTGLVVQLHGFAARNHPAADGEIVASDGTRSPEPWLTDLVQQLQTTTALPALAYPRDTTRLGATGNAQGRALRQTGRCRFLHLELSRELRERLIRDDDLLRAILDCVSEATEQ